MTTRKIILVTGAAGFIGFHLCKRLLELGHIVVGIDNINSYYDINLKYGRLRVLGIEEGISKLWNTPHKSILPNTSFTFIRANIEDRDEMPKIFKSYSFDAVCNLAAQAGVRYSLENPEAYVDSNITGFLNILEGCRQHNIKRLVYASSSSVYGNSSTVPFSEQTSVDYPISLYAATKKSNELMAHTYSHLYGIETIGLRFFTVYGPWGRPDMALFLFTKAIFNSQPIKVYNHGNLSRDFTYIDDIIDGVERTLLQLSKKDDLYKVYNIGNSSPVKLLDFIRAIETITGCKTIYQMMPIQPGDVNQTWADVEALTMDYGYTPNTPLYKGVEAFVSWYKSYYL